MGSEIGGLPENIKQICVNTSLQNGGYSHAEKPFTAKGLVNNGGSERFLLSQPHTFRPQKVPMLLSGGQDVPVHLPTLQPGLGTMGHFQDVKAGCSSRTGARNALIFYLDDILLMVESKDKLQDQLAGLIYCYSASVSQ